ncbi:MAG: hypothetical protein ACRC6V_10705 [Bacteroidales bacterium]
MTNFRSIDELVRTLNHEKALLKEMFAKRKSLSYKHEYALELLEYKESRLESLIERGIIRSSGDFLELEDLYLKFFEEVLEVNEEINTSFVQEYLDRLNENIDYYLTESNENRKYNYYREVMRCLKNISLTTVRNVVDLKRNIDITYKTEPNFQIKRAKLYRLDEKRDNISLLIRRSEEIIDSKQSTFFSVAMDVEMRNVVSDVRIQLNDSYHNLIEVGKQVINYLNMIEYQSRILDKIRKLKYLKEQHIIEEYSNIREVISRKNHLWMEPQTNYKIKLSVDSLRGSDETLAIIQKVNTRNKTLKKGAKNLAPAIPENFLCEQSRVEDQVNLRELSNSFLASSYNLFYFILNYDYKREVTIDEKLSLFCQIVSLNADQLNISETYEVVDNIEYPLIYAK